VIVDANILLYAVDDASPFHEPCRAWLEDALNGPTRVGLPWASLTAFLRIATHPRASPHPLTTAEAWQFLADWLAAEPAWIPMPTPRHADVLERLVVGGDLRGNLITDAHLAALAIEHGVGVCSADSDFARFRDVAWTNPIA
jgi:hypothetical protein